MSKPKISETDLINIARVLFGCQWSGNEPSFTNRGAEVLDAEHDTTFVCENPEDAVQVASALNRLAEYW
jgi:hypothetical protein